MSLITSNFTQGRAGNAIDRVVIHTYGAPGTDLTGWFNNPASGVSAHYSVLRDGRIIQYVLESNTAWHAGHGHMNLRSIGIEHQDNGLYYEYNQTYTEAQYKASGNLIREICERYEIPMDREHIIKHNEVIAKECPGVIDIDLIIKYAKMSEVELIPEVLFDHIKEYRKDVIQAGFSTLEQASIWWFRDGKEEYLVDLGKLDRLDVLIAKQAGRVSHEVWLPGSGMDEYAEYGGFWNAAKNSNEEFNNRVREEVTKKTDTFITGLNELVEKTIN